MKILLHTIFWVFILLFFTILFGSKWNNYSLTFYFFTTLMPIAIGTSYFFNYYLVPKYLLTKKYFYFSLYLVYTIIASLYLEMLAILFAFIVISNYQFKNINPITTDIFILELTIYFIVFIQSFYLQTKSLFTKEEKIHTLEKDNKRNEQKYISVTADRKQRKINLNELLYIESLSDYVKIHTKASQIITKQKISELEILLPDDFLRVHRSYIVNKEFISSFNREQLSIEGNEIPISRKYRVKVIDNLKKEL